VVERDGFAVVAEVEGDEVEVDPREPSPLPFKKRERTSLQPEDEMCLVSAPLTGPDNIDPDSCLFPDLAPTALWRLTCFLAGFEARPEGSLRLVWAILQWQLGYERTRWRPDKVLIA
jgi:hypothetical protein